MFRFFNFGRSSKMARRKPGARPSNRFQPVVESLETREVPAAALFRDINPGGGDSSPQELIKASRVIGGVTVERFFFTADNGISGRELWISDGTQAGTRMLKDIYAGTTGSDPRDLTVIKYRIGAPTQNLLFFTADDGLHGRELWRSDGTTAGTVMVKDIYVGSTGSDPTELTSFNDRRLFFVANDGLTGRELWHSDGRTPTTFRVKDINPGPADSSPKYLTNIGRRLWYQANDGQRGPELWNTISSLQTRGLVTGLVKDIRTGPTGSNPFNITAVGQAVFFGADDGISGAELWRSDGARTYLVRDINPGPAASLEESPTRLMASVRLTLPNRATANYLLFGADNGFQGQELWISNGVRAGTNLVRDINPGQASSSPFMQDQRLPDRRFLKLNQGAINEVLLFGANDGVRGNELWRTSGLLAGTNLVRDIDAGAGSGLVQNQLIGIVDKAHNKAYFAASNGANVLDNELWVSNGSTPGTQLVQDINTGANPSDPASYEIFKNALFFAADNGLQGRELWRLPGLA